MGRLIIDTDIGDDIDDALAIALALNSSELELIGITTVFRNVRERTRLAITELKVYNNVDIPVHMGMGHPLINDVDEDVIPCQCAAADDSIEVFDDKNAVDFIIDTCMTSTDPITLVPIGPLTNIGTALRIEPKLAHKVKIVLMGGYIGKPQPEWNIMCDPEAAHIVMSSGADITMVGLDVTTKCQMTLKQLEAFEQSSRAEVKFLFELIKLWDKAFNFHTPVLHDPLAVAVALDPSLVTVQPMDIGIELGGIYTRGMTVPREGTFVKVAVDVDVERFMELFMTRVAKDI